MSRAGLALGTTAYMPPEQAAGDWDIVDERADVFALGAILCEMLTGRPPYIDSNRDDLLRRARRGDIAEALGRLAKCGADAMLVELCRECLAAERLQRPRHAGVVAERLASYQAEVRERLRQAELERARAEVRALEERRRRRLIAALALAALLLLSGGVAALRQWQRRRAKADEVVQTALSEVRSLAEQAQAEPLLAAGYEKAVSAAGKAADMARAGAASKSVQDQAEAMLVEMKRQAEAAEKDRRLLARLLEAREPHEVPKYSRDDQGMMTALAEPTTEEQFASAFRDWGLDVDAIPAAKAAARLKARPPAVVTEVIAALDHWASQRRLDRKPEAAGRLVELTTALDDRPDSLRRELRDIMARDRLPLEQALRALLAALRPVPLPIIVPAGADHVRLRRLAEKIDPAKEPVLGLMTLTRVLRIAGEDVLAERLLRAAIVARPREVVLYHTLGRVLQTQKPPRLAEAVECYAAARALRPDLGETLALALLRSNREREGMDLLARMLKENSDNPYLHWQLGNVLRGRGELDEAIERYKNALSLDPNYAHAHNNLGIALHDKHDLDGAIASYKKALELDPKYVRVYNNLGNTLREKGDVAGAIACYDKALELDPKYALALYNRGNALRLKGDLDGAIASYRQALKYDPQFAAAYTNLGNALISKGEYDAAIDSYRRSLALDAKLVYAHSGLGDALKEKHDLNGAIDSYRKALALDPNYFRAHLGLGDALYVKHNLDDAIVHYKKAVDRAPTLARAHFSLGNARSAKGDKDGAIVCYKKAIDLNPKYAAAYCNLGSILCDAKNDLDGAIANFRRALALDNKFVRAYHNLGVALQKKGDLNGAIASFKQARALDLWNAQLHYKLGAALYAKPDLDGAIACFKQALAVDPHSPAALNGLGVALKDKGDLNGGDHLLQASD